MSEGLHQRLTAASEGATMTTTLYATTVLELAVLAETAAEAIAAFDDGGNGGVRIHLSLRVLPTLHNKIKLAAKRSGSSMNKFVVFAISEALDS